MVTQSRIRVNWRDQFAARRIVIAALSSLMRALRSIVCAMGGAAEDTRAVVIITVAILMPGLRQADSNRECFEGV